MNLTTEKEEGSDNEVDSVDTDYSSLVTIDDDMNNVDELIDSMVNNTIYSEQDASLDLTAHNTTEFGFAPTHSGDKIPILFLRSYN